MIEAQGLGKTFDDFTAVRDLDLHVGQGELLALLGPNGAGKTTTVRMLGAILKPTTGSAHINGFDVVREADKVRHAIGMLTEQPGLYLRMSGLEYLLFYGRLYGLTDSYTKQRGRELFQRFGMGEAFERRLGTYSKGMRQKAGLIRAMLHSPTILLLDEPTSAMDPHSAKLVRDSIMEMRSDKRAIILCTHNLPEAEALADRIAIINKGAIVADGTTAVLKQQLLGHPQLEVQVDKHLNGQISELDDLVTVELVQGSTIRYRTEQPAITNPQLLRCLTNLGLGVVSLREISQSLEEVYLRVVAEENDKGLKIED
jgi:ABC-2 type transport system ATP-binding protein